MELDQSENEFQTEVTTLLNSLLLKMNGSQDKKFLNFNEACNFLNVSQSFLRKQVFEKKIPTIRMGRCLRFNKAELENWACSN